MVYKVEIRRQATKELARIARKDKPLFFDSVNNPIFSDPNAPSLTAAVVLVVRIGHRREMYR